MSWGVSSPRASARAFGSKAASCHLRLAAFCSASERGAVVTKILPYASNFKHFSVPGNYEICDFESMGAGELKCGSV